MQDQGPPAERLDPGLPEEPTAAREGADTLPCSSRAPLGTVLPPLINLTPVEEVGDRGTLGELSCMLEQLSHPLQDTLTALGHSFPDRHRYRNIYLPLLPRFIFNLHTSSLYPVTALSIVGLSCLTCSTGMDTQTPTLCRTVLQLSPCHCGPTGNPVTGRRDGVLSCCSAGLGAKRDAQGSAATLLSFLAWSPQKLSSTFPLLDSFKEVSFGP